MSVIALCSAKGSPGVTTTAMLLAALWPRPVVLVDADPAGGDVALRLPGPDGRPLDTGRGLLTLLPLARRELPPAVLMDHAQLISGGTPVLAGLGSPEQAGAVGGLWRTLAEAFAAADFDVIIDAGRAHSNSVHLPVLRRADLVVTVLRPTVTGVVHAREHVRHLGPALRASDGSGPLLGMLIVHAVRADDAAREAVTTIRAGSPTVESFGQVAFDPPAAVMFDGGRVNRPERSMLIRSGRQVVGTLADALAQGLPARQAGPRPVEPQPIEDPPVEDRSVYQQKHQQAGRPAVIDLRNNRQPQPQRDQEPDWADQDGHRFEPSPIQPGQQQFVEGRIP